MRRPANSLFATACALILSASVITGQTLNAIDLKNLDRSVSPCQDFYQFANGGWLANNPIPAAFPSWGVDSVLSEQNRDSLREILEAAAKNTSAPKGSSEQKVGDFYAACMAEDKIEAEGLKPLRPELQKIEQMKSASDLQKEIALLHSLGVNALFRVGSTQDAKNSAEVIVELWQGGLGLPEGEYYFKTDDKSRTIRDEYVKHVARMFELAGDSKERAATEAQTVMSFESALAESWMPRVERRDPQKVYNRKTLAQLKGFAPNFDWSKYLRGIGLAQKTDINVGQPVFFERVNRQLKSVPLSDWKTYLRWRLLDNAARSLNQKFVQEDFDFKGRGHDRIAAALEALRRRHGRRDGRGARRSLREEGFPARSQATRARNGPESHRRAQGRHHDLELDERCDAPAGHRQARNFHTQDWLPGQVARLLRARSGARALRDERAEREPLRGPARPAQGGPTRGQDRVGHDAADRQRLLQPGD
jgi:predicted metalloendopeptidase